MRGKGWRRTSGLDTEADERGEFGWVGMATCAILGEGVLVATEADEGGEFGWVGMATGAILGGELLVC